MDNDIHRNRDVEKDANPTNGLGKCVSRCIGKDTTKGQPMVWPKLQPKIKQKGEARDELKQKQQKIFLNSFILSLGLLSFCLLASAKGLAPGDPNGSSYFLQNQRG